MISVLKEIFEREPLEDKHKHKQKNIFLRVFFFFFWMSMCCFPSPFFSMIYPWFLEWQWGSREDGVERIVLFMWSTACLFDEFKCICGKVLLKVFKMYLRQNCSASQGPSVMIMNCTSTQHRSSMQRSRPAGKPPPAPLLCQRIEGKASFWFISGSPKPRVQVPSTRLLTLFYKEFLLCQGSL